MAGDLFDSTIGKNWSLNRGDEPFPDPFMDYASTVMPENIRDALRFCEFIFHTNSMVREAARRIISYFITDIEIQGVNGEKLGDDEKQKYLTFLNDTLKIKNILHSAGLDFLCYGNSFTSLVLPFRRYLSCPKCFFDTPLKEVMTNKVFGFQWKMPEFIAKCPNPNCGYQGKWHRIDRRLTDESQIVVKRWSPYEMEIRQDLITDHRDYIWRIPEDYRLQIRRGDPQVLPVVPWEVVEAVQSNGYLLFDKEVVFHMSEPTLAGVRSRGWGISRTLVNFRQAWYCQVLHRYNEAIALDYVVPFRVLTPSATSSSNPEAGDPLMNLDMGGLGSEVKAMLRKRRRDPAAWNFLSHPIDYKMLGGEANQLAPTELLNQGITTLLNGFGMPAELYNGTLSLQAVLPAIRLFQSSWTYLVHYLNDFLTFIVKRTADGMGWEPATARLLMPTMTDDMNNVMAKLQLMQANQISQSTALRGMGLDFKEETRQIMDEERFKQEEQAKIQEEMETASVMEQMAAPQQQGQPGMPAGPGGAPPQQGGAPAPGGQPAGPAGMAAQGMQLAMPPGPNQKITPQQLQANAETMASQLLSVPEAQRQSEMTKLKAENPTLHAAVKQTIENIRQQARTAGGQAVMQQQFGAV
jgi:hypothetical protein